MIAKTFIDWAEVNQRYLVASLAELKAEMRLNLQQPGSDDLYSDLKAARKLSEEIEATLPYEASINELCRILNLTPFERKIVLLCAGVELDHELGQLVFKFTQLSVLPTFRLALHTLSDAHWSALSPTSSLRYWRLIEINSGELIANSPLKIDEQILHYLTGVKYVDERLMSLLEIVESEEELVPSQQVLVNQIIKTCFQPNKKAQLVELVGNESADKRDVAKAAASKMGLQLYAVSANALPTSKALTEFIRLWNRESALNEFSLLIDCIESDLTDRSIMQSITTLAENIQSLAFISTTGSSFNFKRQLLALNVNKPTAAEQLTLWKSHLIPELNYNNDELARLVSQFNMSAKNIRLTADKAVNYRSQNGQSGLNGKSVWNLCCAETSPQISELAEKVIPVAKWDDLILPQAQKEILREVANQGAWVSVCCFMAKAARAKLWPRRF
jgi:hypothetical protein